MCQCHKVSDGFHGELRASHGPSQLFAHHGLISVDFMSHMQQSLLFSCRQQQMNTCLGVHSSCIPEQFPQASKMTFEMKTEKG